MLPTLAALAIEGGFDPLHPLHGGGALWTWIIFLAALPFMWKFVFGPVTQALLKRDDEILAAQGRAESASANAEKALAEVEVKLGEARTEATKILAAARDRGEDREREIVDKAKGEATALLENASSQIRAEQDKALAAIRAEVVELSLGAAGKVLERNVGSEDDRRLIDSFVGSSVSDGGQA